MFYTWGSSSVSFFQPVVLLISLKAKVFDQILAFKVYTNLHLLLIDTKSAACSAVEGRPFSRTCKMQDDRRCSAKAVRAVFQVPTIENCTCQNIQQQQYTSFHQKALKVSNLHCGSSTEQWLWQLKYSLWSNKHFSTGISPKEWLHCSIPTNYRRGWIFLCAIHGRVWTPHVKFRLKSKVIVLHVCWLVHI